MRVKSVVARAVVGCAALRVGEAPQDPSVDEDSLGASTPFLATGVHVKVRHATALNQRSGPHQLLDPAHAPWGTEVIVLASSGNWVKNDGTARSAGRLEPICARSTTAGDLVPPPRTTWQWQLTGTIDETVHVQMIDIDLFDNSAALISRLKASGKKVVCYFSAGSYENWRPDAGQFPAAVLGNPMDGWPGERWLDVKRIDLLMPIMSARMDLAVQKGCTGVEPDNVLGAALQREGQSAALTARSRRRPMRVACRSRSRTTATRRARSSATSISRSTSSAWSTESATR
jgi:hypothetical protein